MITIQDKSKCSGCHACSSVCPKDCIKMVSDQEGFLYPLVDAENCVGCSLCEKVCPILVPSSLADKVEPVTCAVKNKDNNIREKSSSGGVFTAIAEYILEQGGIVFGAAFNEDFNVLHVKVDKKEDLEKLRGSKYVQSKIGYAFCETEEALNSGKSVLFTGTPCQIGGLKSFLKRDYEKLYTQDLICHGVPSPSVWRKYLEYLQEKYRSKVIRVTFRNKVKSWKKYSISISFENGQELTEPFTENVYMKAFLRNLCLRPSCYDCKFKGVKRDSDITLADFWGVENILPQMDDDKGTSLVMIHSDKGKKLFQAISSKMQSCEVDAKMAIYENGSAMFSSTLPKTRGKFFARLGKVQFDKLVEKCSRKRLIIRIKNKIKKIIKKLLKG